jgi:multidrug efflux system membrane fusion protein
MPSAKSLALVSLVFTTLAATGCSSGEAENAPASPPAPEVTAARVLFDEVRDWAEFTGRLEPVERVELRSRVGGYVESVDFDDGALVEAGEILFRIDARPFRAEVDRLGAELERAAAELELARSFAARARRLFEQNATSREEFEQFTADAAVAEAELAAISAALESAELELSFTEVKAPIAGRVSRAIVTAGNLVDPSTVLTTLVSISPIYAYFDIDEQTYLKSVGPNGSADVHVGLIDEDGYPHRAELDFVDNQVDAGHGTIRARAVLDNSSGRFTPGLFARIRLVSPNAFEAAFVDDRAIGTDLGRKFVYVIDENNVVQYRGIETGRVIGGMRIVTSGLTPDDSVIVNGVQRVRPGVPVAPTRVAMDRSARGVVDIATGSGDEAVALNQR